MKLPIEKLDKAYITSDTHAFHKNICRGTTTWNLNRNGEIAGNILGVRDFDTPEEMTQTLANNFNSMIPDDGILFHLGDWSFAGEANIERFRNMLDVKELHLITGNHDEKIETGKYDHLFTTRQKYLELEIGYFKFVLFHFDINSWNNIKRGSFHLHGHQHWAGDKRFGDGRKMDVGVDGNDLFPYKLTDVIEMLKDRKRYDVGDHHITLS